MNAKNKTPLVGIQLVEAAAELKGSRNKSLTSDQFKDIFDYSQGTKICFAPIWQSQKDRQSME